MTNNHYTIVPDTIKWVQVNEAEIMLAMVIIISFFIGWFIHKFWIEDENQDNQEIVDTKLIDLDEGQNAIAYLERLIKEKYNYYKYLELLPIYLDRKIPEKKIIKEIKEKVYVSVVGSLTHNVKKEILRFFTEKGIEIFVHEKIIIHMNETDLRASEKTTESFRELTVGNIDKII